MKNFKTYVVEEDDFSIYTPVNSDNMITFFESINIKKYNDAMDFIAESNGTNYIYRGIKDTHFMDFMEVTPKKSTRKSANEKTNIYNLLLSDILENWQDYPKRNKSAICSTNKSTAKSYGNVYIVIPQNNAHFGICGADDLWMSFDNTFEDFNISNMKNFTDLMLKFIMYCGKVFQIQSIQKIDITTLTAQNLKHCLELISKYLNLHSIINNKKTKDIDLILKYAYRDPKLGNSEHDDFMEDHGVKSLTELFYTYTQGDIINLIDILEKVLDPHRNGFQLRNFDTLIESVNARKLKDNEVWTDSDILLIREDMMNSFIEYYIQHS